MEIKKLPKIIRHCMTIGMIPTSYKISLTYEEQLLWFCKFLEEEVIPVVNNNSKVVEELKNYLENLDVQEEINNKLDEMAESGELEEIIAQYLELNTTYVFDTLQDLLDSENLINGSKARTLGFYSKNDGGDAFYLIRNVTNEDTPNNYSLIALTNSDTLVAELFTSNNETIKIAQLGIQNDNDTILKYAFTNFSEVDINADLTLTNPVTIESSDKVIKVTSGNKSTITCAKSGIIVDKERVNIEKIIMTNTASVTDTENNGYIGIDVRKSGGLIDNVKIDSFNDGIAMLETYMVVYAKVINCILSYNVRSGLYIKALATGQKNNIEFTRNYFNKNGKNSDNLTTDGDTTIGYGLYISGGLGIKCDSNVYEYNTNCGLYVEKGYALEGFTDINGYYEQNKRCQILFNDIYGAKNVGVINHTSNRPYADVSNALPLTDIMVYIDTIYHLVDNNKNLNLFDNINLNSLLNNGNNLSNVNNLKAIKDLKINDCLTYKVLDANQKLYIKEYSNYQLAFPVVANSTYKLTIKFVDTLDAARFGLFPYGTFTTPIIEEGSKELTNHIYEETFTSAYDTNAMFYQEGTGDFEIEYISLVKLA